jgi:hypothetical protein
VKQRRNTVRELYLAGRIGEEPRAPWLQVLGLKLANSPALASGFAGRVARGVGRALRGMLVALIAVAGGTLARLGARGMVGTTARLVLSILGRSPQMKGSVPGGAAVIAANRCSRLDPLSLVAALPGRVWLCGEEALLEVRGWARFLLRPSAIPRHRAEAALRRGELLVLLPDGPPGIPARRCRFRLDGLDAALRSQAAVIPAAVVQVRGRTVIELAAALGGVESARRARGAAREAIAKLHG